MYYTSFLQDLTSFQFNRLNVIDKKYIMNHFAFPPRKILCFLAVMTIRRLFGVAAHLLALLVIDGLFALRTSASGGRDGDRIRR